MYGNCHPGVDLNSGAHHYRYPVVDEGKEEVVVQHTQAFASQQYRSRRCSSEEDARELSADAEPLPFYHLYLEMMGHHRQRNLEW